MAVAGGSWVATVDHRKNPQSFNVAPTNPSSKALYFLSQFPLNKLHAVHVYPPSHTSPVLEEEEKGSVNLPRIGIEIERQDSRPVFEPGSDDLNRVISGLLQNPESRELAYGYYEKAKENPDFKPRTEAVKYLIKHLVNSKNWDSILFLCSDLKEYRALPDVYTCSKLVSSCIRARKFRIAQNLLCIFESGGSAAALAAFDSAMKGYNKLQMFSSTIRVFERMRSAGMEPSSGCYYRVMEAYERIGDSNKVLELFQEFESKRLSFLARESSDIYRVLCSSLAKSGSVFEALEYFREMKEKEIPESSVLYSMLIRAFADAREIKIVEQLFEEAAGKKMLTDTETCLKVVLMYVRQGEMEKTLKVVGTMSNAKIRVSDCVLCGIVSGFSRQRGFKAAIMVYEELIGQGYQPGQVTYALIINAYCRLELYSKAEMVFEEMEQKGFDKCVVAYSNMVDMYGKTRRFNDALKLVAKMKLKGCKPNIWIYNSLINMHGRAKNLKRVEKIWKEMRRVKIVPDKVSYTSMISAYNRAKEFERCVELYQEFRMNRGEIDKAMAGIMIGVFSKLSRIDELVRLLQDMKVQGAKLDGRLYTSALNALSDAGLQVQIQWLQENFEATQSSVLRYTTIKE